MVVSGVVDAHQQEAFDAEHVVGQRPRPHGLADDGHLVAEFLLEQAQRAGDGDVVAVVQKAGRRANVVQALPHRLAHAHGGPVVLLLPLHLAAQRRRLLDDGEIRHDGVETQFGVAGGRQAGRQFRVAAGLGKRRVHHVHQLHRRHVGGIGYRRAVDGLAGQGVQHPFAGRHGLLEWHVGASSGPGNRVRMNTYVTEKPSVPVVIWPRSASAAIMPSTLEMLREYGSSNRISSSWRAPHGNMTCVSPTLSISP